MLEKLKATKDNVKKIGGKLKQIAINRKEAIVIGIIIFIICMPFLKPEYMNAGDDYQFHISNIKSLYETVKSGHNIFTAKIVPIIANNFGYATGVFYPRLAHTVATIFTIIFGGDIVTAIKVTITLVIVLSSYFMYKLVFRVFKQKLVAMIAAILYITFPYFVGDTFSRLALAEFFTFMFIPMIVLGLYELMWGETKKFYIWFIIGYIGLINSHLVMSVYITIFILIYLLMNFKKIFKNLNIVKLFVSSVLILLICSPFLVPILEHNQLGIYYVFMGETMAGAQTTYSGAAFIPQLLTYRRMEEYQTINQFFNVGAVVMAIYAFIYRKRLLKESGEINFFKYIFTITIISIIMSTKLFPWFQLPRMMIMIQFAWRMETVVAFALSVLAAIAIRNLRPGEEKTKFIVGLIILSCIVTLGYSYKPDAFSDIVISEVETTHGTDLKIEKLNTHRRWEVQETSMASHLGRGWEKEYHTMNGYNNLDYYEARNSDIIVKEGAASVTLQRNDIPELEFVVEGFSVVNEAGETVTVSKGQAKIELPRLYYLGYELKGMTKENKVIECDYYENSNGFMETEITATGTYTLEYKGTKKGNIAYIFSMSAMVVFVGLVVFAYREKKTK